MIQLHPVSHGPRGNRFCGPSALSAITGLPTDSTAQMLRMTTGRRQITGVGIVPMIKVLHGCGFLVTKAHDFTGPGRRRPTLAEWLDWEERDVEEAYLVIAGNHWQVIKGDEYVCGLSTSVTSVTNRFRVKRRARVSTTYSVRRVP